MYSTRDLSLLDVRQEAKTCYVRFIHFQNVQAYCDPVSYSKSLYNSARGWLACTFTPSVWHTSTTVFATNFSHCGLINVT